MVGGSISLGVGGLLAALESNMTATKLKVASDIGNDHISGPRSTYWSPGGSI